MRVPRTRGAGSGILLILLGLWGALIPFVGPYFNYGFLQNQTWVWNINRLWLNVLPGAAVVLGGMVLLGFATRISLAAAAWLTVVAGGWFVVGPMLSVFWHSNTPATGPALGGPHRQALEWLGFHYGLGVLIVFIGTLALGRLSVVREGDAEFAAAAAGGGKRRRRGVAPVAGREGEPVTTAGAGTAAGTGAGGTAYAGPGGTAYAGPGGTAVAGEPAGATGEPATTPSEPAATPGEPAATRSVEAKPAPRRRGWFGRRRRAPEVGREGEPITTVPPDRDQ